MDKEMREYTLGRLRFSLQHDPSERFDVVRHFVGIVEEGGPLRMAALHQLVSIHELCGSNRERVIADIIELAQDGARCCENPLCPINLLIDVAIAALAEGKQEG